jgi:hypothetical protein
MDPAGRIEGIAAIMRDVTPRFEEMKALRRALSGRPASPAASGAGT